MYSDNNTQRGMYGLETSASSPHGDTRTELGLSVPLFEGVANDKIRPQTLLKGEARNEERLEKGYLGILIVSYSYVSAVTRDCAFNVYL